MCFVLFLKLHPFHPKTLSHLFSIEATERNTFISPQPSKAGAVPASVPASPLCCDGQGTLLPAQGPLLTASHPLSDFAPTMVSSLSTSLTLPVCSVIPPTNSVPPLNAICFLFHSCPATAPFLFLFIASLTENAGPSHQAPFLPVHSLFETYSFKVSFGLLSHRLWPLILQM